MTEPEDHNGTRPISVAELLARNGSIGSPPVGGRRRRKRGNSDSVTVAELTGEIPIVSESDTDVQPVVSESVSEPAPSYSNGHANGVAVEEPAPAPEASPVEEVEEPEAAEEPAAEDLTPETPEDVAPEEADYAAHLEQRNSQDSPVEFAAPTRRIPLAQPPSRPAGGAEQMSPDPLIDDEDADELDLTDTFEHESDDATQAAFPSYLRSSSDTLFGGQSVADDLARRGFQPGPEDIDLGSDADVEVDESAPSDEPSGSPVVRGAWVVFQCILAVAFGAGLFIAFDLLWKWNTIVALVLAVLVILGLVVGVRVVRKTEDIGSTLIAVAVGALVTMGPLALLQSH